MKKKFGLIFVALMFNVIMGAVLGASIGLSPMEGAIGGVVLSFVISAVISPVPQCFARAGVLKEVWTGELIKSLRKGLEATFLDGIPDASSIVDNDVIHLVDVGVDPDVLINNTTYPIDIQVLADGDKTISLDKFESKATPITDNELYALSYDKMARVKESHANAINDSKFTKAAHSLCATSNTASTPVIATTGDVDAETGRKKCLLADIIKLKAKMDKLKVPTVGRRLVLCDDHVNDLLEAAQSFREQYNINRADGTVGRLYGFDIYEYANNPLYTTAGVKKALGAAASAGEFQCSFAFYVPRVFKATGSLTMYYSEAKNDPLYHRNLINFLHRFICLPKKSDAGVVLYSGYTAG